MDMVALLVQLRLTRQDGLNWRDTSFVSFDNWHANETGQFYKVVKDYNETQMNYELSSCGWRYPTSETLVERADREGETGSVTIASRRLKRSRLRQENRFLLVQFIFPRQDVERKCSHSVSAATERAIVALSDRHYTIQHEGEQEQQDIFEAQMIRLGDLDMEIEEWEHDRWTHCVSRNPDVFETVSLRSQPSLLGYPIRRRFRGHYGYDW